jgi:hypothetical protein
VVRRRRCRFKERSFGPLAVDHITRRQPHWIPLCSGGSAGAASAIVDARIAVAAELSAVGSVIKETNRCRLIAVARHLQGVWASSLVTSARRP